MVGLNKKNTVFIFEFTMQNYLNYCFLILLLTACNTNSGKKLPILGPKELSTKMIDGKQVSDTIYHTISDFEFVNQKGEKISQETFEGKVYVCDFIFTNCPTICPIMSNQMYQVQEAYADNADVMILSHTVDPERDSVDVLNNYAQNHKANSDKWHFVTGDKEDLYKMGLKNYMVSMDENDVAPGGFLHSAAFILVDKQRRVRGVYNGTDEEEVNQLIEDIKVLLEEYKHL